MQGHPLRGSKRVRITMADARESAESTVDRTNIFVEITRNSRCQTMDRPYNHIQVTRCNNEFLPFVPSCKQVRLEFSRSISAVRSARSYPCILLASRRSSRKCFIRLASLSSIWRSTHTTSSRTRPDRPPVACWIAH